MLYFKVLKIITYCRINHNFIVVLRKTVIFLVELSDIIQFKYILCKYNITELNVNFFTNFDSLFI